MVVVAKNRNILLNMDSTPWWKLKFSTFTVIQLCQRCDMKKACIILVLQIGCTSVFTISLYISLLNVFSQHVSVVYDHHKVLLTCTLTPVFLLFLPTLANVYICR
jgi:hypothetical protein